MNEILEKISNAGIVPVVVIEDADNAVKTVEALSNGGIDVAEVTFRTDAAEESIKRISEARPDIILGAGTVTSIEQVDRAVRAGAKFIVTPGYNPKVVNYCIENSIPVVPGVMDTNSIEMALEAGLDTVKFFPAEQAGGVKMLKALSGPYTKLKFIPTGGINKDNMNEYLSFNKIAAVGGSWMVKKDMRAKGESKKRGELSGEAIDKMLGLKVRLSDLSGYQKDGSLTVYTANKKRADYYLGKEGINTEHINIVEE